jgi:hypothetical protein
VRVVVERKTDTWKMLGVFASGFIMAVAISWTLVQIQAESSRKADREMSEAMDLLRAQIAVLNVNLAVLNAKLVQQGTISQ